MKYFYYHYWFYTNVKTKQFGVSFENPAIASLEHIELDNLLIASGVSAGLSLRIRE
jgi:hypothetical protein